MKILHISLSGRYNDNWLYQENILLKQNVKDGNKVVLVCTTMSHFSEVNKSEERCYTDENGVKIYRITPPKYIPNFLQQKLRYFPKLISILKEEKPDIIFHHGVQSLSMLIARAYKKQHTSVKLFADNHADYSNSAQNFLSKWILNKLLYRFIISLSLNYIEKIFYVTTSRIHFLTELYKIPQNKTSFLPLCGEMMSDKDYIKFRKQFRDQYNIKDSDVVFLHSGKFAKNKKTDKVISIFTELNFPNAKLVIAGRPEGNFQIKQTDNNLNIINLGWVQAPQLRELMCGCDVFLQPGRHSVLFEQSILCRLVSILEDVEHNRFLISQNNGFLVKNDKEIKQAIIELTNNQALLLKMKYSALKFASQHLDYSTYIKDIFC